MEKKRTIDLLWVFRCEFEPGSIVKPHSHEHHYLFIYVDYGDAVFLLNEREYTMGAGDCALIKTNERHGIVETQNGLIDYEIKFTINDPRLKRMLHDMEPVLKTDALARKLIEAVSNAASYPSQPYWRAGNCYLLSLLYHLCDPFLHKEATRQMVDDLNLWPELKGNGDFSSATCSILRYIQSRYTQDISLESIAKSINYNKNYICNVFRKDTGRTINEYLTDLRVARAEEMLTFSDYSLSQIAARTGFNSISHFNRTFKKKVGVPPGQYKRIFPENEMMSDLGYVNVSPEMRRSLMYSKWLQMRHSGDITVVDE